TKIRQQNSLQDSFKIQGFRKGEGMIKDFTGLINATTISIRNFTDCAVLGLSGGADSTLVAILSAMALGQENVYGIGLPYSDLDKQTFNSRSARIAHRLNIHYLEIPIKKQVDAIIESLRWDDDHPMELDAIQLGNIKARVRMATL